MRFKSLVLLAATATALASPGTAHAQTPAPQVVREEFAAAAKAVLEKAYPDDAPGATAIFTRRGKTLFAGGRGLADVDKRTPLVPQSVMPLGSITKQFTAALVLQLAEEGMLSLDDPLSRFFPDWPEPSARATVRQLLNHSSGLFDFSKVPGWIAQNREKSFSTEDLLATIRGLKAKAEPGTEWEYNNGGYVVLGAIVERVTGVPWHEAVEQRIARPLGLSSIAYAASPEALEAVVQGHGMGEDGQEPVALSNLSIAGAAGGLVGNVADLARWAQALHGDEVVDPVLYKEMISPARLASGKTEPYGFGLRLRQLRGNPAFVHGGALAGFATESVYIPAADTFVAVFANSDDPQTDPQAVMMRLAAMAVGSPLPDFEPVSLDPARIAPLFGLYERTEGQPLRFFERGGKAYLGIGEREMELTPGGHNLFYRAPDGLSWVEFVRDTGGAPLMLLHDPSSREPEQARRTGEVPAPLTVPQAVLASYHGVYQTETVALTVSAGEDGWLTVTADGKTMPLRPVSQTEFMVDGTPMKLVFHPEGGKVDKLTLHRGARQLNGVRK